MAKRKFKFVEMFVDPETGAPYEGMDSPKEVGTQNFGKRWLHQIARIEYEEQKSYQDVPIVEADGTVSGTEKKEVVIYREKMGIKGGWIEKMNNLAQTGDCWVGGGYVVGNAVVSGNVKVGDGEIGENARVDGDVQIDGDVCICGNAHVYGKASVKGKCTIGGSAMVAGSIEGGAKVYGNAFVGASGKVTGLAEVFEEAQVYGEVSGKAQVGGASIVYGEVLGEAEVTGAAIILKDAKVGDKAVVNGAVVAGLVGGEAVVYSGQPTIGKGGKVSGKVEIRGNAVVDGTVADEVEVSGNASVEAYGALKGKGFARKNAAAWGDAGESEMIGTAIVGGSAKGACMLSGGVRIGGNGSVSDATVGGSVNVNGNLSATASDNAVVCLDADCSIPISRNEVFVDGEDREPMETGADAGPTGAAVICKVDGGEE